MDDCGVRDLDSAMAEVRDLVASVVELCSDALDAGIAIEHVQGYYIRRVDELLGEAEAQALLARSTNEAAMLAIEGCTTELLSLRAELVREIRHAAGGT